MVGIATAIASFKKCKKVMITQLKASPVART